MTVPGGSACNEHKVFFLVTLEKGLTPKGPNRVQHRPERVRGEGGLGLGPGAPDPVPDPRSRASVAILDQPCMYLSACISTTAQRKGSCAILCEL